MHRRAISPRTSQVSTSVLVRKLSRRLGCRISRAFVHAVFQPRLSFAPAPCWSLSWRFQRMVGPFSLIYGPVESASCSLACLACSLE